MNSDEDSFSFICAQETSGILEVLDDSSASLPEHNPSEIDEVLRKASSDIGLLNAIEKPPDDLNEDKQISSDKSEDVFNEVRHSPLRDVGSEKDDNVKQDTVFDDAHKSPIGNPIDQVSSRKLDSEEEEEEEEDPVFGNVPKSPLESALVGDSTEKADSIIVDSVFGDSDKLSLTTNLDTLCPSDKLKDHGGLAGTPSDVVNIQEEKLGKESDLHDFVDISSPGEVVMASSPGNIEQKNKSNDSVESTKISNEDIMDIPVEHIEISNDHCDHLSKSQLKNNVQDCSELSRTIAVKSEDQDDVAGGTLQLLSQCSDETKLDHENSCKKDVLNIMKTHQDVHCIETVDLEEESCSGNIEVPDIVEMSSRTHSDIHKSLNKLEGADIVLKEDDSASDLLLVDDSGLSDDLNMEHRNSKTGEVLIDSASVKLCGEPGLKQRKLDVCLLEKFSDKDEEQELSKLSVNNGNMTGKTGNPQITMVEDLEDIIIPHVLVASRKNSPSSTTDNEEKTLDTYDTDSSSSSSQQSDQSKGDTSCILEKDKQKHCTEELISKDSSTTLTIENKRKLTHTDWSESSRSSWETEHRTKSSTHIVDKVPNTDITLEPSAGSFGTSVSKRKHFDDDWSDSSDSSWEPGVNTKEDDLYSGVTDSKHSAVDIAERDAKDSLTVCKEEDCLDMEVSDSSDSSMKVSVISKNPKPLLNKVGKHENKHESSHENERENLKDSDNMLSVKVSCSNEVEAVVSKDLIEGNIEPSEAIITSGDHVKEEQANLEQNKCSVSEREHLSDKEDKMELQETEDSLFEETESSLNDPPIPDQIFDDSVEDLISSLTKPVTKQRGQNRGDLLRKKTATNRKDHNLFVTTRNGKELGSAADSKPKISVGTNKQAMNSLKKNEQSKASNKDSVGLKSESSRADKGSSKTDEPLKGAAAMIDSGKLTFKSGSDEESVNVDLKQNDQSSYISMPLTRRAALVKEQSSTILSPGRTKDSQQYVLLENTSSGIVISSQDGIKPVSVSDSKDEVVDSTKANVSYSVVKKSGQTKSELSYLSIDPNKPGTIDDKGLLKGDSNSVFSSSSQERDKYRVGHSYFVVKASQPPGIFPKDANITVTSVNDKEKELDINQPQDSLIEQNIDYSEKPSNVLVEATDKSSVKFITHKDAIDITNKTVIVKKDMIKEQRTRRKSDADLPSKMGSKPSAARTTRKTSVSDILLKEDNISSISKPDRVDSVPDISLQDKSDSNSNLVRKTRKTSDDLLKEGKSALVAKEANKLATNLTRASRKISIVDSSSKEDKTLLKTNLARTSYKDCVADTLRSDTDRKTSESLVSFVEQKDRLKTRSHKDSVKDISSVDLSMSVATLDNKDHHSDVSESSIYSLEPTDHSVIERSDTEGSAQGSQMETDIEVIEPEESLVKLFQETQSSDHEIITTIKNQRSDDSVEDLILMLEDSPNTSTQEQTSADSSEECEIISVVSKKSDDIESQTPVLSHTDDVLTTRKRLSKVLDAVQNHTKGQEDSISKTQKKSKLTPTEKSSNKMIHAKPQFPLNKVQTRASKGIFRRKIFKGGVPTTISENEPVHATRSTKRGSVPSTDKKVAKKPKQLGVSEDGSAQKNAAKEMSVVGSSPEEISPARRGPGRPRKVLKGYEMAEKKVEPASRVTRSGDTGKSPMKVETPPKILTPTRQVKTRRSLGSEPGSDRQTLVKNSINIGDDKSSEKKKPISSSGDEVSIINKNKKRLLESENEENKKGLSEEQNIDPTPRRKKLKLNKVVRPRRRKSSHELKPCVVKLEDVAKYTPLIKLQEQNILGDIVKSRGSEISKTKSGGQIIKKVGEINKIKAKGEIVINTKSGKVKSKETSVKMADRLKSKEVHARIETDIEEEDEVMGSLKKSSPELPVAETGFTYMYLKRNLFKIALPSILWARQVETNGRFVSFTRVSSDSGAAKVSVDKGVLFEGSVEPAVFFRDKRVYLPIAKGELNSLDAVSDFLLRVHRVAFCVGGLQRGVFSKGCRGYVDAPNAELRCSACVAERKTVLAVLNRRLSKRVIKPNTRFLT